MSNRSCCIEAFRRDAHAPPSRINISTASSRMFTTDDGRYEPLSFVKSCFQRFSVSFIVCCLTPALPPNTGRHLGWSLLICCCPGDSSRTDESFMCSAHTVPTLGVTGSKATTRLAYHLLAYQHFYLTQWSRPSSWSTVPLTTFDTTQPDTFQHKTRHL